MYLEDIKIEESWKRVLKDEFSKDYFKKLSDFVRKEYLKKTIYPAPKNIFKAFSLVSFEDVKVVILGQDPYHRAGQASGLSFSVEERITIPPSLQNIFKEIEGDLKIKTKHSGNLERWAKQGVLLLNAILTVQKGAPGSHQDKGWEDFTDEVIKQISEKRENIVFLLWGNYAKKKGLKIDRKKHLVLESAHPSPFSAYNGFFGSKHFSQTNDYLKSRGKTEIDWA